ncbi:MAG: bifunctional precorrin-2 dehydrogenase/sirohydrochlorin ferrochelatase [Dehalococcoidia bacterium]
MGDTRAAYYPVFLNIAGRRCLVIGGGEVAERKVASLLDCGGRVTVISPRLSPGLEEKQAQGAIEALARDFQPGDLEGAFLVIAATDDPGVNDKIVREARKRGILINVVDQPGECDFIVPSTVHRGELVVAISTGGQKPGPGPKDPPGYREALRPGVWHPPGAGLPGAPGAHGARPAPLPPGMAGSP